MVPAPVSCWYWAAVRFRVVPPGTAKLPMPVRSVPAFRVTTGRAATERIDTAISASNSGRTNRESSRLVRFRVAVSPSARMKLGPPIATACGMVNSRVEPSSRTTEEMLAKAASSRSISKPSPITKVKPPTPPSILVSSVASKSLPVRVSVEPPADPTKVKSSVGS